MTDVFDIAGYARISVDDELDQKNISIENQKAIIEDFVKTRFPGSTLTFFEDRDRSGYTFDQRESYQEMRRGLMSRKYDILIIKDFSRFSRRNSRGLVELEDLRDAGVRIISIGDGIDFPGGDDWLKIQFQFLVNEMPVTDTSRKVRSVIKRRQADGEWLCAAPYGYIINSRREFEIVPTEAEIVRTIFDLYNNRGWGYKKIANYLTDEGVPTPRMSEQMRREADGKECKRQVKAAWAIVTVQGILDNDFYIGTLRQGKYTRAKINGRDVKRDGGEHIVIENHHQAIIGYRTFAATMALRKKRSRSNYRGVKINDNVYSGFLECGNCGSPMFAMSRSDLAPAYTCGTYHRRGLKGCTSHHIRADKLDELLKIFIKKVMENSAAMIEQLNRDLARENDDIAETEQSADNLAAVLDELTEEMKVTKRQRIREIMKKPEQEASIEAMYDELEAELQKKIDGLNRRIDLLSDKRNAIIQVNRTAKTAIDIFRDILEKEKLERNDLELLIDRILVFEDHLEIRLQADIDALLRCGSTEDAVNFNLGTENIETTLIQSSKNHGDKVFRVNVISNGDPLEIYTDREGEVIFKKYSPIGEMNAFAEQYADTLHKTCLMSVAICDRDCVIACAGVPRKDFFEKRLSADIDDIIEKRGFYQYKPGSRKISVTDGTQAFYTVCAMPIISGGDVIGCVASLAQSAEERECGEAEAKLTKTAAGFLSRQFGD
ncbi:MAG: stage V sporulation T C-terminal domain-containing protein [Firmicutes bacterium]|nr:stage V sporulation T C-terminal domain-containing protein [Bacillota bacterium]